LAKPCEKFCQELCESLQLLAKTHSIEEDELLRGLINSLFSSIYSWEQRHRSLDYSVFLDSISIAPSLVMAFEYLLFKGFTRLLKNMYLEDLDCYSAREEPGCDYTTGFSMYFLPSSENAPDDLEIGIGYDPENPVSLRVVIEATVSPPIDIAEREDCDLKPVVRRTISSAKRTRAYRNLVEYMGGVIEAHDYGVSLEPLEDEPGINVSIYADSHVPGFLLPFDLNPVLDLLDYLVKRLRESAKKRCS